MAKKINRIHSVNYFYLIPQAAILLVMVSVLYLLEVPQSFLLGISFYFLLSIYLKVLVPRWHRKGIYLVKKGKLDVAILAFQRSYQYFTKYTWIDKYRAFTLLSTSALSYSEMALINIIYCFEQMGDTTSAKKFRKILKERFPDSKYN